MNAPKAETPVEELLEKIRQAAKDGDYIFRGEPEKYPKISSNLYRLYEPIDAENFDIKAVENEIIANAKMHTHERNDDVILEQLQHYRGKTNQIDFSTDYLIALFFACDGNHEKDGRLILLKKEAKENIEIYKPTSPQNRVIAQKSIFVRPSAGFVEPDDEIIVPSRFKEKVLDYLNKYHNINTATIYNDIHGYISQTEIHESAYTHFYRGVTYQNKGKSPEAFDEYTKSIKLNPGSATAHNNRGNIYGERGKQDLAIADYNKAIALNPIHVLAHRNRGVAYSNKNEDDLAIDDFNKAIELNPNDATAYNNRGGVYASKGNYDIAIDDFNKAIELNPNYAIAYSNRGIAYSNKNEHDLAIADCNKAIELNPNDAIAYKNRGGAYFRKGDYVAIDSKGNHDRALDDYNKAIELDSNYAEAYFNRGVLKRALKFIKGAREDFQYALRLAEQQGDKDIVARAQKEIYFLPPDSDS